jgi:hypothetical protein
MPNLRKIEPFSIQMPAHPLLPIKRAHNKQTQVKVLPSNLLIRSKPRVLHEIPHPAQPADQQKESKGLETTTPQYNQRQYRDKEIVLGGR